MGGGRFEGKGGKAKRRALQNGADGNVVWVPRKHESAEGPERTFFIRDL